MEQEHSVSITGLTTGLPYLVMVCEYNGIVGYTAYNTNTSTNNPNSITPDYQTPTTQASGLQFADILSSGFTVSWTRGNGSQCIVFIKLNGAGNASPVNNTTYTANPVCGNGSQIGATGWYCVYKGSGTSVFITGLASLSTYRVMVCEFNGIAGLEKYLTTSPGGTNPKNQITDAAPPTVQASQIIFGSITTSAFDISWTRGNGANCAVFVKIGSSGNATPVNNTTYTANTSFGSGTQIGASGWYCVFNSSGSSCTVTGLSSGTQYIVMACEYFGSPGSEKYNTNVSTNNPNSAITEYNPPTVQASSISYTSILQTSATVNWIRGNGMDCAVFIAQTNTGTAAPVNHTTYTANVQFGLGTQIGSTGWYCIYNGSGNSVSITGLTTITTYRTMVIEYNGAAGREVYNTNSAASNPQNFTTIPATTTWNGSAWDNGPPNSNVDAIIAGNYAITTNITCKSLAINSHDSLKVQPGSSVTVYGNITNNGDLILKSPTADMTASGSLITYGSITNNGTMYAERYITPGTLSPTNYVWHYMSSPVPNFKASVSLVGDYLNQYVESTNLWQTLTKDSTIKIDKGYIVKTIKTDGQVITFKGTFNTGNQSINLNNTGADDAHGYNIIGNPYPSAIDWNAPSGLTLTNIYGTIWIWNPTIDGYATWDGTIGTNGGSQYIPAMQGIFIKVNSGSSTGNVTITNAARVNSNQIYLKSARSLPEHIRLRATSNNHNDEVVIYKASGTNGSYKLFSIDSSVPRFMH